MPAPTELDLFSAIVGRLTTGVIVVSTDHVVLYANSAAQRLLHPTRLRRGQSLPDNWEGFSLPTYVDRLFESPVPREEIVGQDTGRVFAVTGIPARRTDPAVILVDDVSARDRRGRAEREFVANAAHELLTPLTGIVAAAHVLEAGAKEVPEERDRFIAHIARECDRLARMARALLVLARAQAEDQPARVEIVPLSELLEQTVDLLTDELPIATKIECAADISVLANRDLLEQALRNLSVNAIKHGIGDELHITADRLGRDKVAIVITDRGGHSPLEEFEPPGRFDQSGGPDTGGFGLGISIAEQSLEVLGATLTYQAGGGDGLRARIEIASGDVDAG
jgi:signal transduction histidine kinase